MGRLLVACALVASALLGCGGSSSPARLYGTGDGLMRDRDGNVLLLRSVAVSNVAKYAVDHLFDLKPEDVQALLTSGVNSVRLLTFWKAITPTSSGEVDSAYLDRYLAQVRMLTAAGLYVVVDMHQDLWGVPFEIHGAPDWACPAEIKDGYVASSPWWVNYGTRQVSGCFDHFWSSADLQAKFAAAWAAVAGVVCGEERVLGFDLLNEPYAGSDIGRADFDNAVLLPFYQQVMAAVETVCPGRLYFLEPTLGFSIGITDPMQIPTPIRDRVVYSSHFYPTEVHEPDGDGYSGDRADMEARLLATVRPYLDAGVPIWIGEWGGITTGPSFDAYVRDLNSIFAAHNLSASMWDYQRRDGGFAFLGAEGQLKAVFADVFLTPVATLLPSRPVQTPDWTARSLGLSVTCAPGRSVEILFPTADCSCTPQPASLLDKGLQGPGVARARCLASGSLQIACRCGS